MESIRKITDIDPQDLPVVERLFGRQLTGTSGFVLVLRTIEAPAGQGSAESDELPAWCNVLEGLSDQDRDEILATLKTPVRLAHSE